MNECMGNCTESNLWKTEHELCIFLLLPGIETQLIGRPNRIVVTPVTELFQCPASDAYEYKHINIYIYIYIWVCVSFWMGDVYVLAWQTCDFKVLWTYRLGKVGAYYATAFLFPVDQIPINSLFSCSWLEANPLRQRHLITNILNGMMHITAVNCQWRGIAQYAIFFIS